MSLRLFVAAGLTIVCASAASSQGLLDDLERQDLTPEQRAELERLESLPTSGDIRVVMAEAGLLLLPDDIEISLSNGQAMTLGVTERKDLPGERMTWDGATAAAAIGSQFQGQASIALDGEDLYGTIWADDGVYSLAPLGEGAHALIRIEEEAFPPDHPPGEEPPIGSLEPDTEFQEEFGANQKNLFRPSRIRVLLAVTPAAEAEIGATDVFAARAFESANLSFRNSDVDIILETAGVVTVQYVEPAYMADALSNLVTPDDGALDSIHSLRDARRADMVVLIVDNPSGCGLATIYAAAEQAFAVVHFSCAVEKLAFAHEIGHLLGACHNPEEADECVPFDDGHGFIAPDMRQRTVMGLKCKYVRCTRQPQWSRPPQWGTAGRSHDARVLNANAARAAAFRP